MTDAVSPQLNTASGDTAAEVVEDVLTTAQDRAMTVAHRGLPAPGEATADDVMPHTLHDNHSDLVDLPLIGKITVPGGIYTAVFGILAILTLFEVLIAELLDPRADRRTGFVWLWCCHSRQNHPAAGHCTWQGGTGRVVLHAPQQRQPLLSAGADTADDHRTDFGAVSAADSIGIGRPGLSAGLMPDCIDYHTTEPVLKAGFVLLYNSVRSDLPFCNTAVSVNWFPSAPGALCTI